MTAIAARAPAGSRIAISAACGLLAGVVVALVGPWWLVPLAAWDLTAVVFLVWMWRSLWRLDAAGTAALARREDPERAIADSLLLGASLVSLLAVGLVLVRAGSMSGLDKGLLVGLCVTSIVLGWAVVHMVFTLKYARLYFAVERGGGRLQRE